MARNHVSLEGTVTTPPFIRRQPGNYTVASFKLSVPDEEADRSDTFRIVGWNGLATFIEDNLKQGMTVSVEGALRTRTIPSTSALVTEVVARHIKPEST